MGTGVPCPTSTRIRSPLTEGRTCLMKRLGFHWGVLDLEQYVRLYFSWIWLTALLSRMNMPPLPRLSATSNLHQPRTHSNRLAHLHHLRLARFHRLHLARLRHPRLTPLHHLHLTLLCLHPQLPNRQNSRVLQGHHPVAAASCKKQQSDRSRISLLKDQ